MSRRCERGSRYALAQVDEGEAWHRADFQTVCAVAAVWRKRGGRGLPTRHDIDPLHFGPGLLPHLMLIEVRSAADYFWRLCGERASFLFGERLAKRTLGELERSAPAVAAWREVLDCTVAKGAPVYFEVDNVTSSGRPMRGAGAMLPLRAPAGEGRQRRIADVLGVLRLAQLSR
ncbi:PAS domain-containing protein [Rhodovibrio sodomensis]|uniref:PAS domain-containing protein n=1 Tax=Rhodovibrio sodomensis TaxID=1088 RepID=UPI001907EA09